MGVGKTGQALIPEFLVCLQGSSNNHKTEELMKQPDYSDKIKHLLGNLQGQPGPGPSGGKRAVGVS